MSMCRLRFKFVPFDGGRPLLMTAVTKANAVRAVSKNLGVSPKAVQFRGELKVVSS